MDHTPMQQAVMEHMESGISFPLENNDSISHPDTNTNHDQIREPLTYDELFPELPNAKMRPDETNSQVNSWAKNSDMRIATSVITHIFQIPYEERAKIDENSQFGESASSRICADITSKTGARIEISTAKDQSLNFLVTGKSDEVMKARAMALERFQTQARHIMKVPREHHPAILGKKGRKLQDIEEMSSTKIHIPNAANPSDEIVIRGTREGIEKAVHEIRLISDELSKQACERMDIPKIYHPFVNPIYNEKISQIVSDSNVRVNIPPQSMDATVITVAGEKEGVMSCKNMILKIYKEMEKKCQSVSIEVKKSQHKYVIGQRGANIAEFLQTLNVYVEVPSFETNSDTIILRGPQEKLGSALTLVYEKANSMLIESVDSPSWINKYIIGHKKTNIKQIIEDHPKVHVFLSGTENGIKLEGPKEEVDIAKEKLENMISDMQNRLKGEEVIVNPQHFKHIIGKSGSNINRIRNDHQVVIDISESNGRHVICLEGTPDDVEAAKRELHDIVTKLENEKERELHIDQRFYGLIIGAKGEKIKEIREKFNLVAITFPNSDSTKADIVKVRGPKQDVDECCSYLLKLTKEMAESSYQIKITIYRDIYKFIIGKSGSKINKIREETNTRIDLPVEGEEVAITGRKEDCERARQMIQQIQNEMANIVDMEIIIPAKFHNSFIGAGGKFIRSISEECGGVTIKFPSQESKSDKVFLRGPKDDVMKAKQMLIDMSNEKQLSSCTAEIKAKPEFHRFLIGRSGANIRKIRDKTGARIIFPNENDHVKDVITIIGKKEAVEMAKAELKTIIQELDKVSEETISIDPKFHKHFVARGGEVLREIADQYGGVRVSFPRQGDISSQVVIKGVHECVGGAKERILAIVEELKQEVVELVEIPQKHHRNLMGPRGSKVQLIQTDFDVSIKFPDKDTGNHGPDVEGTMNGFSGPKPQDIIVVKGKRDKCLGAKEALFALVPIQDEMVVPFKYHRFIIGQKGEFVRCLMNEHDVNVKVPPAQEYSDKLVIIGPRANVEKAKDAIQKKVQECEGDEEDRLLRSFQLQLNIDPQYHSKIIGRRGTVVSKIRDKFNVNIQFPSRGSEQEDLIIITGYEKNCNDAKAAIMKITGDLENLIKKDITIDSRIHSRLIGAKGWAIRKVMDEYKVEIKFPRDGDDPSLVVVMGKPDNVEECIDHLLNLEEEYMQDITDREETKQYVIATPSQQTKNGTAEGNAVQNSDDNKGFVVAGAPWTQPTPNMDSSEDFPSMGSASTPSLTPAWGPKRG